MIERGHLTCLLLLFVKSFAQPCYWKSNNTVRSQDAANIYACPDSETHSGGTQLCCIVGSQCGTDGICRFPEATLDGGPPSSPGRSGWNTGGCTDPSYSDPVCPIQCMFEDDWGRSRIVWNASTGLWHCCGHENCTTTPTEESFMAVSPQNWRALVDTPNSTMSTSLPATTTTSSTSHSATNEPTASPPISNNTGLSVGAKAGIGVSCGASGVIAILAAAYFIRKKKATQTSTVPTQDASFHALDEFDSGNGGAVILPGSNEAMSNPKHEMSTESTLAPPELGADLGSPRELSTDQRRYELA